MSHDQVRFHLNKALAALDALEEKPEEPDRFEKDPDGPTIDDVRAAIESASTNTPLGPLGVTDVMKSMGADRVSDLKPEQYANFLETLNQAISKANDDADE